MMMKSTSDQQHNIRRVRLLPVLFLAILVCLPSYLECVERKNFKTCAQSGFCKRQRNYKPERSPYQINMDTVKVENGHLSSHVTNTKTSVVYVLDLFLLKDSRLRFRFNELNPLKPPRYEVDKDQDIIVDSLEQEKFSVVKKDANGIELKSESGTDVNVRVVLNADPLKVEIYNGNYLVLSFNAKQLLKFEHLRMKDIKQQEQPAQAAEPPAAAAEGAAGEEHNNEEHNGAENVGEEAKNEEQPAPNGDDESDMWEETFQSHTDSKPYGPESIGMDITFNDFQHVYGIPEHADKFALRTTTNDDPYRLYNLDVFKYELNNPMALYGSIPYMIGHNEKFTIGVLWLNAAETWVDVSSSVADKSLFSKVKDFISKSNDIPQVETRWMSESGVIDVFVMLGPKPTDVFRQYGKLTGNTPLPPLFSIAYHQCRWNYNDEQDVRNVNAGFEEHQLPMDVMWLDIEHTNDKRYFTWDSTKFPTPDQMMTHLSSYGRKLVTIVDPHIKSDNNFNVYSEAKEKNFFVKDKNGNALDGWCWPGSSAWPDFLNQEVRNWWASKFLLENYKGTTLDTYTWNDMNEPSMFNGPEITFPKDALHLNGFEHRAVHNLYGLSQMRATFQGHLERSQYQRRPFILTRSTFVGSQRFGAVWTGDNMADWEHLKISIPMCLSFSVAGMSFVGADIGGFFDNPDAELMVRWYQAAAYQPFFRSHAHIDTKRREPWLFGDSSLALIRDAIHARYTLLYYWYTLFYMNEKTGKPPMLPLWAEFPSETNLFDIDNQHMIGPALMIKPITSPGATSVDVLFPGKDEVWYDVKSMRTFEGDSTRTFTDITLSTIPVFQRGGHIVPYKFRLRRSSTQMDDDPFTLLVTLDKKGQAKGLLYFDDGLTYNYKNQSEFVFREFVYQDKQLISRNLEPSSQFKTKAWLERVIIYGINGKPNSVKIEYEQQSVALEHTYDASNRVVLIRRPGVKINVDFKLIIE